MSGAGTGVIRNCRVRCTYADGININNGSTDVLVENNHIRGTGDDGLAILSEVKVSAITRNIVLRHNTVVNAWWGVDCDLAGGMSHLVEGNSLRDGAGLAVNLPASYPNNPLTGAVVRDNEILRAGCNFQNGQRRGAIWIYAGSTTISDLLITENLIQDPIFRGIHLAGGFNQVASFERNVVDHPGEDGVFIESSVIGSGTYSGNSVTHLRDGYRPLKNNAGGGYTLSESGNSWQ
jgi:polygalacturonase